MPNFPTSADTARQVVIVYGASFPASAVVAERIAAGLAARGFPSEIGRFGKGDVDNLPGYCAAVLVAPVPMGDDDRPIVDFVRTHRPVLERLPVAFVALASNQPPEPLERGTAQRGETDWRGAFVADTRALLDRFFDEAGWRPNSLHPVAGTISYRRYNFVVSFFSGFWHPSPVLIWRRVPEDGKLSTRSWTILCGRFCPQAAQSESGTREAADCHDGARSAVTDFVVFFAAFNLPRRYHVADPRLERRW